MKSEIMKPEFISNQEDPEEIFQMLEKLGQGSYGSVYKVLHKVSGKIMAAKILNIDAEIDSFEKEIQILKNIKSLGKI